ncbi:MAG: FAD-dependent oxidoreductase [Acidimicrobiia bacterium]|nr:MAG: FAD-dependent oxidoreductase [Acidimicrobiia bacterium]
MQELDFFDSNIPCLAACPVHTNAGLYVAAIAEGDDEGAYLTARLPNPFASVCARVCAAPCEDACRRGTLDTPIAIRALKRFVTERHGIESGDSSLVGEVSKAASVERTESIGIIGGGPCGLAAAHDLRKLGYQVTIYEATDTLGGMMVMGIPEYRLPRDLVAAEIQSIIDMGVDVRFDTQLGKNIEFTDIKQSHDAVLIAIGATLGRGLDLEGHESDGVLRAIEYLINANRGFAVDIGEKVVVIGGGDVAMDSARTALRSDAYEAKADAQDTNRSVITAALDAARTAARTGARQVTVISLESKDEMPADEFELEEAIRENIDFVHRRGPARILSKDGAVVGLETVGVRSVFDADGRFSPVFDSDDLATIEADTVILAIGQAIDVDALGPDGPEITPRRTIGVGENDLATSVPMVWAGGDAAHGPRSLIDAIADGRKAASQIHETFGGAVEQQPKGHMVKLQQFHRFDDPYDSIARVDVPTIPTDRRIGLAEVETGFTPDQARCEAQRCLRCFANILLEADKCVLCGLCVDVCPVKVISIVPAEEVDADKVGATALLLDERGCIRCALCVERCPTKALSMGVWSGVGVPTGVSMPITLTMPITVGAST